MRLLQIGCAALAVTALAVLGWKALPGRTSPVPGPDPVAVLEPVRIGMQTQWLLIRGADRRAPVLLWLHGGPGAAQMPLARITTRALEADFVVVHWDQPGAGRSNPRDFDAAGMTLERYLSDAHAVIGHLRARLGAGPVIVVGHSWGSMLGARLAARHPQDIAAYVGVGQQVSTPRGIELALDWLRPRVAARGGKATRQLLDGAVTSDFLDHARYVALMRTVEAQGGGMGVPAWRLALHLFLAPEYSLADTVAWLRGARRGSGPMWRDYIARDLLSEVQRLEVPVLVIAGSQDFNTPTALAAAWVAALDAPAGKRLEVFGDSGHAPFLTEPDRFAALLRAFVAGLGPAR